jgi:autotransporter translocation and assembly factor TamB
MMLTGQKVDNLTNARIYAGTELGDNLSVGVNAGMGDDGSEFVTRYKLTDKIQLEGTSSSSKSGANIIYTFEVE